MLFLRIFQHLLPDAAAWRIIVTKTLRKFFEGLAGFFGGTRDHVDAVLLDAFPDTTRELSGWENQFGLNAAETEAERRTNIGAAWAARGGQTKAYIEGVLQSFGFDVHIYEWPESGPPYVARDPHLYTSDPSLGVEPGYLVNKPMALPSIPTDPLKWRFFIYLGGPTWPSVALVPASRRLEFEAKLLQLRPAQQWIVTGAINYVSDVALSIPGTAIAATAISESAICE